MSLSDADGARLWNEIAQAIEAGALPLHLAIWADSAEAVRAWDRLPSGYRADVIVLLPNAFEVVRAHLRALLPSMRCRGHQKRTLDDLLDEADTILETPRISSEQVARMLQLEGRAISLMAAARDAQIVRENRRGYRETAESVTILSDLEILRTVWIALEDYAIASESPSKYQTARNLRTVLATLVVHLAIDPAPSTADLVAAADFWRR